MAHDIQKATLEWMTENHIQEIFEVLTAQLLFHKPKDPKSFLVDLLQQIKTQGAKHLLDEQDLEAMFRMFDVTGRGVITRQQAYRALKTVLGPKHKLVQERGHDSLDAQTLIDKDQFVESMSKALTAATPGPYDA